MRLILALGGLALLLGCSQDTMTGPEGPPEYREGYAHGCESALAQSGIPNTTPKQNEARFAEDPQYRQGWDDGFSDCAAEGSSAS
ncbi:MAG: hypothetical protein AAF495_07355 [Pseudomonadota bacterium]